LRLGESSGGSPQAWAKPGSNHHCVYRGAAELLGVDQSKVPLAGAERLQDQLDAGA
jgi:hypothetical protein